MANKVLIADDQLAVRVLLEEKLREREKEVLAFSTGTHLVRHLEKNGKGVELVVVDLDFGSSEPNGIEILKQIKQQYPELPVIILTGKGSVEAAVEAVQQGAADFIEKDLYIEDKLELSMDKIERMLQVLRDNARLKAENATLDQENTFYRTELGRRYRIVSTSPKIQAILEQIEQLASIPRPVLIRGERGTGKELIAAALHYDGNRHKRPFVKLNCAAVSDNLLESELFGHEKGAFTGAIERRRGRFEHADGGTLFLDEVGNTALDFQQKLLRVIEYQEFERLGGNQSIKVDVRVIAATNADLEKEIAAARFRADLYDRLRFSVVHLPPLRDRLEDVKPLIEFFAHQMHEEVASIPVRPFSSEAVEVMERYPWPGNVRELKFAVERALCMASAERVKKDDLPAEIWADKSLEYSGGAFDDKVQRFERDLLQKAWDKTGGHQKEAAQSIGLSYDRFRHLLRKHEMLNK